MKEDAWLGSLYFIECGALVALRAEDYMTKTDFKMNNLVIIELNNLATKKYTNYVRWVRELDMVE